MNYPVMEHYYTIQGEGMPIRRSRRLFYSGLAGCDVGLHLVRCEGQLGVPKGFPHSGIFREMLDMGQRNAGANRVVITGGEPAMYDLSPLCEAFFEHHIFAHIETSAAHEIKGRFDWICISPKKFKVSSFIMKCQRQMS